MQEMQKEKKPSEYVLLLVITNASHSKFRLIKFIEENNSIYNH